MEHDEWTVRAFRWLEALDKSSGEGDVENLVISLSSEEDLAVVEAIMRLALESPTYRNRAD